MTTYATLRFELDADGIALITLDDPSRTMNVTSPELVAELIAALDRVAGDPAIRGAVLTSGKPGSFVAGGDIKDFVGAHERGMSEAEAFEISHRWNTGLRRIERCGKPVAAAINGVALGGGFELCLCCAHRVLADHEQALVGLVELSVGLLPAGGGTQRLPRLIGVEAALDLMLNARRLRPAEALALGAVDAVVPPAQLLQAARDWVRSHTNVAQPWDTPGWRTPGAHFDWTAARADLVQQTRGRYPAPLALFDAVHEGLPRAIEEGLRIESMHSARLLPGAVARNLMRSGFVHRQLHKRFAGAPQPYVLRLRSAFAMEVAALQDEGVSPAQLLAAADSADWCAAPWPAGWPADGSAGATAGAVAADETLVVRLLCAVALEAVRCLDDGSVPDAAHADVGSLVGVGFPRWTGGVLSYIETVGIVDFVAQARALARAHGARFEPPAGLLEIARLGRRGFYAKG